MHCAVRKKFACQCLPQRIKPQTWGGFALFLFSLFVPSKSFISCFCKHVVSKPKKYQYPKVPFLYRAKNQRNLGLLALFFVVLNLNNL